MAYVGPWGTFIRIPRTSSTSYMQYLTKEHKHRGVEHGHYHWYPMHDTPRPWLVTVRPPAQWLRSAWAYLNRTTEQVQHYQEFLGPVAGVLFTQLSPLAWDKPFEEFAEAYLEQFRGSISWLFDCYMRPGVDVITKHAGPLTNTSKDYFKPWPPIGPALERRMMLAELPVYSRFYRRELEAQGPLIYQQ